MNQLELDDLLKLAVDAGASDLHLGGELAPKVRMSEYLFDVPGIGKIDSANVKKMLDPLLSEWQRERFDKDRELTGSYSVRGVGRFRFTLFQEHGAVAAVFRYIPFEIPGLDSLGLPPIVEKLSEIPRGLVLVTGPARSGRTTTLASMVDQINSTRACHIVTIEDPIEFLHLSKSAKVDQREVGSDATGFGNALRHVLKQDCDVIMVGEMRELDTISAALTAAETGHLVLASLHSQDAPDAINRTIEAFPPYQQQQARGRLARILQAVLTQQLLPNADGTGWAIACEVLVGSPVVKNLIRQGRIEQLGEVIAQGSDREMISMDHSIEQLVRTGAVSQAVAFTSSSDPEGLKRMLVGGD